MLVLTSTLSEKTILTNTPTQMNNHLTLIKSYLRKKVPLAEIPTFQISQKAEMQLGYLYDHDPLPRHKLLQTLMPLGKIALLRKSRKWMLQAQQNTRLVQCHLSTECIHNKLRVDYILTHHKNQHSIHHPKQASIVTQFLFQDPHTQL